MQTTITINDNFFAEAVKISATHEYIANHKQPITNNILDLFGTGGILSDYDYKSLHCNH